MSRRAAAVLVVAAFAALLTPAAAAGGGCLWEGDEFTSETSRSSEATAFIAGCRFEPTTLYIQPGTTVTWTNKDPVPHSVTGPFLTFNSDQLLDQGESATVTFDEVGVFPYYCVLHPGMAAAVIVGDPVDGKKADAFAGPVADSDDPPTSTQTETSTRQGAFYLVIGLAVAAIASTAALVVVMWRRRRTIAAPGPAA